MYDLPKKTVQCIERFEPVDMEGLRLWPIRVGEYDEFLMASPAIDFLQQSLPVALMSMPLLQAYYAIDVESVIDEQLPYGFLSRAMLFLALALRLGEGMEPERRIGLLHPVPMPGDGKRLKALVFSPDGEELLQITPAAFQRLRPVLAAQNGIELLPDDTNPVLAETEREVRRRNAPKLNSEVSALVASVAVFSGAEETDIYDWPILKLLNRQQALKRAMDYLICGIGESQGGKWKNGNPVPNPFFERVRESGGGVIALDEYMNGAAADAVERQQSGAAQNPQ